MESKRKRTETYKRGVRMKYIRIKNGACAVNDESYNVKYIIPAEEYLEKYYFDVNCIIAQADTIEELCDEFVVIEETQNYVMERCSYKTLKDNGWIGSGFTIYGAIWTDKGLIYVAKMNDKGELELI